MAKRKTFVRVGNPSKLMKECKEEFGSTKKAIQKCRRLIKKLRGK